MVWMDGDYPEFATDILDFGLNYCSFEFYSLSIRSKIMVSSHFCPPPHTRIHCSSIHKLPNQEMPVHELSGGWQMHRYYIYNKYFLNKLTTLSLCQKSYINNSIVNKIKSMYRSNYTIVICSHKNKYMLTLISVE